MEPCWITEGRRHLGLAEIPGQASNPTIQRWLRKLGAWWNDDATPWCGTYVAHCLRECSIAPPKAWYRAKAYLDWGLVLDTPRVGCIVVYERQGGGHVGFVLGKDRDYRLLTLGGNQGDAVTIRAFEQYRVLGYRWPREAIGSMPNDPLPIINGPVPVSRGEA